jgi:5-methylcytosine-specific restriction endonuclease McrA
MSIVESLTCECWEGKVFASRASLKKHHSSIRHTEFLKRGEERQLRIRNAELEKELARVKSELEKVKSYLKNPSKRSVSQRMKKEVGARAGWKCEVCRDTVNANFEVDHRVPLFKAGDNSFENLQLLCPDCHRTKTAEDATDA